MVTLLAEAIGAGVPTGIGRAAWGVAVPGVGMEGQAPHEVATLRFAAVRVAALLGLPFDETPVEPGTALGRYCLPISTLSREEAHALGIADEAGLWGGVVPAPFVATKLVSHPLWRGDAVAPPGWRAIPGIEQCTLPGYSVFSRHDAAEAAEFLLRSGEVRMKRPFTRGGHGQTVVRDARELSRWLQATPEAEIARGLVIERHLACSLTYSVGDSVLPGHRIAYYGEQRATLHPQGEQVYGGSVLTVVAGGMDALLAELPEGDLAAAVRAATRYDRAVRETYGVLASRRNYDVIAGIDSRGQRHLGVLEQSWRFGGASMAEVLALERFAQRPEQRWVTVETAETYGDEPAPPDAVVYWPGDGGLQSPRKCARIVRDGR